MALGSDFLKDGLEKLCIKLLLFLKTLLQSYGIRLSLSQRHSDKVMALDAVFLKLQRFGIKHNLSEIGTVFLKHTLPKLWH